MTTLNGYADGYTLAAGGYLTITSTGDVGGAGLVIDPDATCVSSGLIAPATSEKGAVGNKGAFLYGNTGTAFFTLTGSGAVFGGGGGRGVTGVGSKNGYGNPGHAGGAGGTGLAMLFGGFGTIASRGAAVNGGGGGAGGTGANGPPADGSGGAGAVGGAGGAGVSLLASYLGNGGAISGGAGGNGGQGGYDLTAGPGGAGGAGGAGVYLGSGSVVNRGAVTGGAGGGGGAGVYAHYVSDAAGNGGAGGAGAIVLAGAFDNVGSIQGGSGGVGGAGGNTSFKISNDDGDGGNGGNGGAGVTLQTGTFTNLGSVQGGGGGAGGVATDYDSVSGAAGRAGDGVDITGAASLINRGTIGGHVGVDVAAGAVVTLTNFGTIAGAYGSVILDDTGDLLIAESGAFFGGEAVGGGGVLEFAGETSGTLSLDGGSGSEAGSVYLPTFAGFGGYLLTGAEFFTMSGADIVSSGQTLTAEKGAKLEFSSANISGAGVIAIDGGAELSTLYIAGTTSLSGSGEVALQGHIAAVSAGATLDNVGETIVGAGIIGGKLTLVNDGTIDADGGTLALEPTATATNHGLVETTATGLLKIAAATLDNVSGRVRDAHDIVLDGGTISGGGVTILAGGRLVAEVDGGVIDVGSRTITNAGAVEAYGAALAVTGNVNNSGDLVAENGALTIDGAVTGSGVGRIGGKGTLTVTGAFGGSVTFVAGATGTFAFDAADYTGAVSGLSKTGANRLDLTNLFFSAGDTASYAGTASSGALTILDGSTVLARVKLSGDYLDSTFDLTAGSFGSVAVTAKPEAGPAASPVALTSAMAAFAAAAAVLTAPVSAISGDTRGLLLLRSHA